MIEETETSREILKKYMFRIDSDMPLELVFTKTLYNMIQSLTEKLDIMNEPKNKLLKKRHALESKGSSSSFSSFKSQLGLDVKSDEPIDDNPNCSILIKNELGVDIMLVPSKGFKVRNFEVKISFL